MVTVADALLVVPERKLLDLPTKFYSTVSRLGSSTRYDFYNPHYEHRISH